LLAEHRFDDAARELQSAEWSAGAWTRTNIELGRALLGAGRTRDAIAAFRDAYLAPLDAMGRYTPHSEIDWWMARAFGAAGMRDSAVVYAGYARLAWQHADPATRALLDSLPK